MGIIFTYSAVIQDNLGWCFNCFSFTENNMISVERAKKYAMIEGEKSTIIKGHDKN